MKDYKSHFRFSKRQRNGILFLAIIIVILQSIYFFGDFSNTKSIDAKSRNEIQGFQDQIDALKQVEKNSIPKIYPFNPNFLTDFKAYQLGLNVDEIDRLFTYRKSGKFVNSAKEFQEVTGINDSLLAEISPYFKFPEWTQNKSRKKDITKEVIRKSTTKNDLNTVTKKELQVINGIGEKLANRIVAYRELLQGYTYNEQLYEVYYLDKATANKVLEKFEVKSIPKINPININEASFKEILHLPYTDYNLTKKIVNFRDENGGFLTLESLKQIDSFPLEKFDLLALYLTAE